MSEELKELNDALGDALAVVAKQNRYLLEYLQDFYKYLSDQYMAAEEEYELARAEAYADVRERLKAIIYNDPKT